MKNYVDADAAVEYLFVEKADKQVKVINDVQGYIMGYQNLYLSGPHANITWEKFRAEFLEELDWSVQNEPYFTGKPLNIADYKFALIDNEQNSTEFTILDERFFDALMESLRNLVIVGENFDLESFKQHQIFQEWFNNHTNRA